MDGKTHHILSRSIFYFCLAYSRITEKYKTREGVSRLFLCNPVFYKDEPVPCDMLIHLIIISYACYSV